MKMMQGAFFLAWSNMSRTRDAPTPTNISTKSEPEMVKKGTLASPATGRALRVRARHLPRVPRAPDFPPQTGLGPAAPRHVLEGDAALPLGEQLGFRLAEAHG